MGPSGFSHLVFYREGGQPLSGVLELERLENFQKTLLWMCN